MYNQELVGLTRLDKTGQSANDIYNLDLSINNKINNTFTNKTTFYFLSQRPSIELNLLPAGTVWWFIAIRGKKM